MKLQEYRSKEILAAHGVPLLAGETATTPDEARRAAERIGAPVVVKAQVLVGGRGKAGGVKLAATPNEAEQRAGDGLRDVVLEKGAEHRQAVLRGERWQGHLAHEPERVCEPGRSDPSTGVRRKLKVAIPSLGHEEYIVIDHRDDASPVQFRIKGLKGDFEANVRNDHGHLAREIAEIIDKAEH